MRLLSTFSMMLLMCATACSRSAPATAPSPYTLAGLRAPHDHVDHKLRFPGTVVLVSFFSGGRMSVAQHCYVLGDGQTGMIRFVENWAVQGGGPPPTAPAATMPEAIRQPLCATLARLPASQPYGRDADVFLVSWEDGGKWTTRTYDRTKLPPEVLDVCKLVGIPPTWLPPHDN